MPGVPLDALAQVKRGLRGLFSRRKKKKQPPKPEPTPSSDAPAGPVSPVEAPTTSKRSVSEAEDAPKPEEPAGPPQHPAADPTTTTATSLMPDSPSVIRPASPSAVLPASHPSERQSHISAPSQIEDAKAIDLNPARDIKIEESGIQTEASDVKLEARSSIKPKLETGMSATSGPMGDHMAEVWRDSDVGAKEGRPVDLEGGKLSTAGIAEGPQGGLEGGKF